MRWVGNQLMNAKAGAQPVEVGVRFEFHGLLVCIDKGLFEIARDRHVDGRALRVFGGQCRLEDDLKRLHHLLCCRP